MLAIFTITVIFVSIFLIGFAFGSLAAISYKYSKKNEYDHLSDHYSTPKEDDDIFGV